MRLGVVVPGFGASEADWCIPALHHLVRRLAAGHDVRVLALRHPSPARRYRFFGAEVRALGAGAGTGGRRLEMLARALRHLGREHRRRPLDAVLGLWADEAGFVAARVGRRLGVRSVVSVMGGELVSFADIGYGTWLGRTGRWLVRRALRRADVVTVGSSGLVPAVRRVRPAAPVVRAPLGVDPGLFRPDGEPAALDGDPCLLHVASLTPVKDQATLLAAFAEVRRGEPAARLHLVGRGALGERLAVRARELGIGDAVRFHGAVRHDLLPPVYRRADLHLVSSRFESQGMTVLEAAACGTATVGTAVGILPDLGDAARTAPVGDPPALAAAVRDALPRRRELAGAARAAVEADLTLDRCIGRLLAATAQKPEVSGRW